MPVGELKPYRAIGRDGTETTLMLTTEDASERGLSAHKVGESMHPNADAESLAGTSVPFGGKSEPANKSRTAAKTTAKDPAEPESK